MLTMPSRPSLEKWSRQRLEEQFYGTLDQNVTLQKEINELERKLRASNNSKAVARSSDEVADLDRKCRKLERENQLLGQKLKVMKHQLLTYTKTESGLGRPASRLSNMGNRREATQEKIVPMKKDDVVDQPQVKRSRKEEQRETSDEKPNRDTVRQTLPHISSASDVVRMHLQNQAMESELDELRFNLESNNRKLNTLSKEYDRLATELEDTRRKLRDAEHRLAAANSAAESREVSKDSSESVVVHDLEIATKELAMLKDENKLLKVSQDRLIASALEQETSAKTTMQELGHLKSHVDTLERSLSEESERRRKRDSQVTALQAELMRWRKKYERAVERMRREINSDDNTEERPRLLHTDDEEDLSEMKFLESRRHSKALYETKETSKSLSKSTESIFNRLFSDVIDIVNTHIERDSNTNASNLSIEMTNEVIPKAERQTVQKWQKMYEEIYVELEKVRNLLVTQYNISESLKKEMTDLRSSIDCERRTLNAVKEDCQRKLRERDTQIGILENQLRSIASGNKKALRTIKSTVPIVDDTESQSIHSMSSGTELTLRFTKLTLSEAGLRRAKSLKPVMFVSAEFFDFELETTPLLRGPEAIFEYSTVYDLVVSNLLIHCLETDGICVELFEVQGATYEQWGGATISLKSLLFSSPKGGGRHLNGQLKFHQLDGDSKKPKPTLLAALDYHIDAPFDLLKAFNAQKRKMTAALCLPMGENLDGEFNELYVNIHRCTGLNAIKKVTRNKSEETYNGCQGSYDMIEVDPPSDVFLFDSENDTIMIDKRNVSVYAAYEIFELSVHLTASQSASSTGDVQFNDLKGWKMPLCSNELHKYLTDKELFVYLIEDAGVTSGVHMRDKFSTKSALGYVNLPLFPLAKNQSIRGAFPIIKMNNEVIPDTSVEVSVYWRFVYVPPDESIPMIKNVPDMTVEKPRLAKTDDLMNTNKKPDNDGEAEIKTISAEISNNLPDDILKEADQWIKSTLNDDVEEKKRRDEFEETIKPIIPNVTSDIIQNENPDMSGSLADKEKLENYQEEYNIVNSVTDKLINEDSDKNDQPGKYDPDLDDRIIAKHSESANINNRKTINNEKTVEIVTSAESIMGSPSVADHSILDSSSSSSAAEVKSIASDATYSPPKRSPTEEDIILNGETQKELEKQAMNIAEHKPELHKNDFEIEAIESRNDNECGDPFELDSQVSSQMSTEMSSSNDSSLIVPPSLSEAETTPPEAPKPPVRRSLMINSSNSSIKPAKTITDQRALKAVEFTEPLHSSIPPSETSSFGDTVSESGGSKSEELSPQSSSQKSAAQRKTRGKPPNILPSRQAVAAPPSLRHRKPSERETDGIEPEPRGATTRIRIGRLRLIEGSPLLNAFYDHAQVFVEWNFLDFEREKCETRYRVMLPRNIGDTADFNDDEKVYDLNRRQIALLRQWTSSNNRLMFTLVLDASENDADDLDDLCVGEVPLAEVVHKSNHFLTMRDVSNVPFATLEVLIQYSDKLRVYL